MYNLIYRVLNKIRFIYFFLRYNTYREKYNIHKSFIFNGVDIELYGDGDITIGENSYLGNRSSIASAEGQKVIIGDNCSISHNVRMYTKNRNSIDIIKNEVIVNHLNGDISIGNNTWIGANVFINQGVNIGSNVVIGANSFVNKNIPSNSIAAGNPAKIIKQITNF